MGMLFKIAGCTLVFSMMLFASFNSAEAKNKTIRDVSFSEPDYELTEVVDSNFRRQVLAQHAEFANAKIKKPVDINTDSEPSLREPAQTRKSPSALSFKDSYQQFQKQMAAELEDY